MSAHPNRRWTPEEDALLRCATVHDRVRDLAVRLHRTEGAVRGRLHTIGVRRWNPRRCSKSDIDTIKRLGGSVPDKDIAKSLGITIHQLCYRRIKIGLQLRRPTRWTAEDERLIRELAGKIPLKELAQRLGRTDRNVCTRALRKFGISTRVKREVKGYPWKGRKRGHIAAMEKLLGRNLKPGEKVHHIDCRKDDPSEGNLWLCENTAAHSRAHRSIDQLVRPLLQRGVIGFDRSRGEYFIVGDDRK